METEASEARAQRAGRNQDETRLERWTASTQDHMGCGESAFQPRQPWEAPGCEGRGPGATVPFLITTLLQVGREGRRTSCLAQPRGHGGLDEATTVEQREEHTLQLLSSTALANGQDEGVEWSEGRKDIRVVF